MSSSSGSGIRRRPRSEFHGSIRIAYDEWWGPPLESSRQPLEHRRNPASDVDTATTDADTGATGKRRNTAADVDTGATGKQINTAADVDRVAAQHGSRPKAMPRQEKTAADTAATDGNADTAGNTAAADGNADTAAADAAAENAVQYVVIGTTPEEVRNLAFAKRAPRSLWSNPKAKATASEQQIVYIHWDRQVHVT